MVKKAFFLLSIFTIMSCEENSESIDNMSDTSVSCASRPIVQVGETATYVITKTKLFDGTYSLSKISNSEFDVLYFTPDGDVINYTFTEKKDVKVVRIPKHKANWNVGYAVTQKTNASVSYQFTSDRLDTNFATFEDVTLESFSLIGANVNHKFSKRLSGFLAVSNIFNEEYTEITGFTTRGTNVRVGFSLNL